MAIALIVIALCICLWGLTQTGSYLTLPVLFGGVFGLWFGPQLIAVGLDPTIPRDGHFIVSVMAVYCLVSAAAGWWIATGSRHERLVRVRNLATDDLIWPVIGITCFALVSNLVLASMREQMVGVSQWTGPIVIVNFFAQLRIVAMISSLMLMLKRPTPLTIGLASINLAICLPVAFLLLRRTDMIAVGVGSLGALYFQRKIKVPVPLLMVGGASVLLVVFTIGAIRGTADRIYESTGQRVPIYSTTLLSQVDFESELNKEVEGAPDVRNAIYDSKLTSDLGNYYLGASLWNDFVFQYVPSGFVGADVKQSLIIGTRGVQAEEIATRFGYFSNTGTTRTGVGSSYRDFWYFGAVYFLIMGIFTGWLYKRGLCGDVWMQTAYLSLAPFAMTAITHNHGLFFISIPIFMLTIIILRTWTRRNVRLRLKREAALALRRPVSRPQAVLHSQRAPM